MSLPAIVVCSSDCVRGESSRSNHRQHRGSYGSNSSSSTSGCISSKNMGRSSSNLVLIAVVEVVLVLLKTVEGELLVVVQVVIKTRYW